MTASKEEEKQMTLANTPDIARWLLMILYYRKPMSLWSRSDDLDSLYLLAGAEPRSRAGLVFSVCPNFFNVAMSTLSAPFTLETLGRNLSAGRPKICRLPFLASSFLYLRRLGDRGERRHLSLDLSWWRSSTLSHSLHIVALAYTCVFLVLRVWKIYSS